MLMLFVDVSWDQGVRTGGFCQAAVFLCKSSPQLGREVLWYLRRLGKGVFYSLV